jgi:hypothetical protein
VTSLPQASYVHCFASSSTFFIYRSSCKVGMITTIQHKFLCRTINELSTASKTVRDTSALQYHERRDAETDSSCIHISTWSPVPWPMANVLTFSSMRRIASASGLLTIPNNSSLADGLVSVLLLLDNYSHSPLASLRIANLRLLRSVCQDCQYAAMVALSSPAGDWEMQG